MAINTYFQNIADAIREKTGGSGLITPGDMPEEIRNISTGGSGIDLTSLNFIGFIIRSTRTNQSYVQACNIRFIDEDDNVIELPTTNSSYGAWGGSLITSNTEGADKVWKTESLTNHYKTIISKQSYQNFYMFYMKNSDGIDLSNAVKWQWYTAEDEPNRDPTTFGLCVANGNETNGVLKVLDFVTNQTITTSRNTLAYEKIIEG